MIEFVAVLAITVALVVIGILNLRDRLGLPPVAADGIEWVDTADGVQAKWVSQDSPLAYAVRKVDYVKAFFYVGRYDSAAEAESTSRYLEDEEVDRPETLGRYLENQAVGDNALYAVLRAEPVLQAICGFN